MVSCSGNVRKAIPPAFLTKLICLTIINISIQTKRYGMRKLVEFGTVLDGSKGYFVDYAASTEKFSKYLPIAQDMKNSFKISMSKRILR
jgi:hypothetical protein